MSKYFTFLSLLFLLATSCTKPANNGIPSYLEIEKVKLVTTADQGSSILPNISDVWVESDGVNLGVFEYPNVIPALFKGNRSVLINPGVFQSGDFFVREVYPCYQVFDTTATFVETDTVTINPTFRYKNEVNFLLVEGFETGNIFSGLNRTSNGDSENLEGRAGLLELSNSNSSIRATMGNSIAIPQGPKVYVEFHYKGSNDFGLGLESLQNGTVVQSGFFAGLNATDDWRKIYIELTNTINGLNGDSYNFYIEAVKIDSLDNSNIYFDNFKLLTL